MSYYALMSLKKVLNNSSELIQNLIQEKKDDFCKNETSINIAIGLIGELRDVLASIDQNIYILNKDLYELITPIQEYSVNLFNDYKIVNAYKLYDFLKIDFQNLKTYINEIGE